MTPSATGKGREGPRKYAYNIDAAREREMHLYLPYWGFSESEKFAQQSVGKTPNVSRDNVLTAFAQLASLRLHAKCALISLFDRTTQHVVAEASPTLGLRSPKSGDGSDSLWRGVQQLPRQNIPMCDRAMRAFTKEGQSSFMIPDLTQDSRFKSASFVTGAPHHRFYISVPIRSPEHYIIGSVAVLDDKPRENISTQDMHLLEELSITVMEYLLSQRAMREENREEKMVRALGLFVRGKSDLSEGIDSRDVSDHPPDGLDHVNKRLEEVRISDQAGTIDPKSKRGRTSVPSVEEATPASVDPSRSRSPVRKFKMNENQGEESDLSNEENEQRPALTPTTERLQKSLAPSSVQSVLNRASCLMNQALEIEGAMFIDASVYTRRQMMGVGSDSTVHTESDDQKDQNGHRGSDIPPEPQSNSAGDDEEPKSLVLGYSTSTASGRDDNKLESHYVPLPGSFVNHLIERYPRGKIFHIEKDGSIALSYEGLADDVSQAYAGKENEVKPGSPKDKEYQQETMEIKYFHKLIPDARCLAIYPVWDFHRSRWFTMSLAWTNDPGRVLSEPKDLTYMAAFSNTVMAEVSRMDVEAADRAKGDFISSISHELRSPLHGVLGTVELLQETVNSYTQQGLVETVYSCGRTLLDTLNHLLDYARINTLTASPGRGAGGSVAANGERPKLNVPGLEQDEDLSSLVQEVVEGLLAGAEFHSRETGTTDIANQEQRRFAVKSSSDGKESRMMTIVDIEWQDNWHYSVYAGAWRRVVMNLFGNALKYTGTGYIRLFMRKDTMTVNGQKNVPAARLTISDSGRGMSQDFLLHNLYIPFLQENTQSPGLGVGLHLVHQIVKSLNGQIHFKSEVDRGTEVDVYFPLTEPQPTLVQPTHYHQLREELSGKSVSFFTKSFERGDLGIRPEVFDNIRFSLGRMVSDWFGLQVVSSGEAEHEHGADFLIVTEHEYRTMSRDPAQSDVRRSVESRSKYPLIVLSGQASSWKVVKENDRDRAIFLSQPVSPKTLATVFESCLRPQKIEEDVKNVKKANPDSTQLNEKQNEMSEQQKENSEKRVLLVEDNAVNLKIIETCAKNSGFKHESATNGLEASEKFENQRFDIVVMDISMPQMDGLTATRKMRQFEKAHKLTPAHIIILTAVLSSEKQEEARVSGVNDFLTKPTPLKQLSQLLRTLPHLNNPEKLD
ncbi:sensor histidine kinase/response regulator [Penicillium angulare]|uniref:Sensor histidine kinase/response regulator n=1 Tax=Penicillium angulare TaxID=116970 RepID=A0A9W9FI55_9EURO|nr:sensor histidine kinase/response regulator [Penicillium angulare]